MVSVISGMREPDEINRISVLMRWANGCSRPNNLASDPVGKVLIRGNVNNKYTVL